MAYTTIDKGSKYFNTVTYTGNGSSRTISGVGFQPDLVWTKSRSNTGYNHQVHDNIRGANKVLWPNLTNTEGTADTNGFLSFQSDGFNLGADTNYTEVNVNGQTYVAWNWLASNTTASNTSGTITSTVSANTTSGFSIVSYTGDGVNNRTVGHGLGVTPKFIIIKNRDNGTAYWSVINPRSTSTTNTNILYLNRTDAEADDTNIMGTNLPNSTTFGIGDYSGVNVNGNKHIAYCFAEVKGFSKFGSYTGNGSTDGTFVYTGFTPAFLIVKLTSYSGAQWYMYDNKRSTYNLINSILYPNLSNAEGSGLNQFDFYSNGFKARSSNTDTNDSGQNYIYMAFASNPFVSSKGLPVTAR